VINLKFCGYNEFDYMIKLKDILMESFKDWFSGSKVTDSHGNPLRMYHGTHAKKNFSVFNAELRGAWFTANPKEAGAYAGGGYLDKSRKYGRTIPVFLNIKNPMKFTEAEFDRLIGTWDRFNTYKKDMSDLKKKAVESGYDGFHFIGSKYDIYVAFNQNQIRSSITLSEVEVNIQPESLNDSTSTVYMYHGGKRWTLTPDSIQPSYSGRYEGGVGIYFTNSYTTARKYAKGGKVVHIVEIDKNYRDINSVMIPVEEIINFVKSSAGMRKKNDIIRDILGYSQRTNRTEISGEIFNNLIVNHEAGSGRPGVEVAKFLVSKGIDASLQKQSGGEFWLVVFNPKIIKKVTVVNPSKMNVDTDYMLESNEFEHTKDRTTLEKELSTLVSSDQSGRNKYKEYLKKYTNWQDAAASYASDTGADKNDLFGDAGRISKAQSLIKKHLDVILSNEDILNNAWLLVQHMDNDVKFQTWFLSKLPKNSENYRYLYDRVMVNLERKQKYNTQRMEEKVDNRSKPPTGYKVTPSVVSNEKRIK